MENAFSDRITDVPRSFIREILKVTIDASIISFAGGLPNRLYFPVQGLQQASHDVFAEAGADALQYANTEGFPGLRQWIADRYRQKEGLDIPIEDILITTGSQQGLDLLGKTFLNEGDDLVIEEPGYLGAIQAFAMYRPRFHPVPVAEGGMDIATLTRVLGERRPKLLYTVTNFQNPCGISYSDDNRRAVAELVRGTGCLIIQDDPYGDLRFTGSRRLSFKRLLPAQTVLLGCRTNNAFLRRLLADADFHAGRFHTGTIAEKPELLPDPPPTEAQRARMLGAAALSLRPVRDAADAVPAMQAEIGEWRN